MLGRKGKKRTESARWEKRFRKRRKLSKEILRESNTKN